MTDVLRILLLRLRSRGRLCASSDVHVARGVRIRVAPGARVVLGPGAALGEGSRIEAVAGTVRIGPGARLGERAIVVSHAGVEIGANARIGDWAALAGAEPTFADVETPIREQPLRRAPVTIGAGAVLGPHVAVGPGVAVPAGRVVEPYAVLTSSA